MSAALSRPLSRPSIEVDLDRDGVTRQFTRTAGAALIAGFALMAAGAIAWSSSGVDIDGAVETGTIPQVLGDITAASGRLTAMSTLWLCGMVAFTIAAVSVARMGRPHPTTTIAGGILGLGAVLAAVSYMGFATLVHGVAADSADPAVATAVAWMASKTDWVATILVLAIPLPLLIQHGQGDWAPRWLLAPAALTAACGALTAVALLTGSGLTTFGFALVPVGMVTTVITGVLLCRA